MLKILIFIIILRPLILLAATEAETKKTYIEDIFIWKMSDELKLTATEEKKFSEILKNLNKKKSDLNKQIQELTSDLNENKIDRLRKLILQYSQLSVDEFDQIEKLIGKKRFVNYLQIKSELNNKVKSIVVGEKPIEKEKKDSIKLPPPQVIIEKNEQ